MFPSYARVFHPADPYVDSAEQALPRGRSPSLWWPDDRSWCVACDSDLMSTYIGASAECVQHLADDGRLEVLPDGADRSVAMDADTINPEPDGEYTG